MFNYKRSISRENVSPNHNNDFRLPFISSANFKRQRTTFWPRSRISVTGTKRTISQQISSNKRHLINNKVNNQSRDQSKYIQRSIAPSSSSSHPQSISVPQAINNTYNDTPFGTFQHFTNNNQASPPSSGNTDDSVDLEDDGDYFRVPLISRRIRGVHGFTINTDGTVYTPTGIKADLDIISGIPYISLVNNYDEKRVPLEEIMIDTFMRTLVDHGTLNNYVLIHRNGDKTDCSLSNLELRELFPIQSRIDIPDTLPDAFKIDIYGNIYEDKQLVEPIHHETGHFIIPFQYDDNKYVIPCKQLVMDSFSNGFQQKYFRIAHIDGDVQNNSLSNLRFMNSDNFVKHMAQVFQRLYGRYKEEFRSFIDIEFDDYLYSFSKKYIITNLGAIYNIEENRMVTPITLACGSLGVELISESRRNNESKSEVFPIDELVTLHFIGEQPNYHRIRHINNNMTDNSITNLDYIPESEEAFLPTPNDIHPTIPAPKWKTPNYQIHDNLFIDNRLQPNIFLNDGWTTLDNVHGLTFENYYISARKGIVMSFDGETASLVPIKHLGKGYKIIELFDTEGIKHKFYVHLLMAWKFCEGESNIRNIIHYRNGDRDDNNSRNLEWQSIDDNRIAIFARSIVITDVNDSRVTQTYSTIGKAQADLPYNCIYYWLGEKESIATISRAFWKNKWRVLSLQRLDE